MTRESGARGFHRREFLEPAFKTEQEGVERVDASGGLAVMVVVYAPADVGAEAFRERKAGIGMPVRQEGVNARRAIEMDIDVMAAT